MGNWDEHGDWENEKMRTHKQRGLYPRGLIIEFIKFSTSDNAFLAL